MAQGYPTADMDKKPPILPCLSIFVSFSEGLFSCQKLKSFQTQK